MWGLTGGYHSPTPSLLSPNTLSPELAFSNYEHSLDNYRNKIPAKPIKICLKSISKLKTLKWFQINLYQYSNNFYFRRNQGSKFRRCRGDTNIVYPNLLIDFKQILIGFAGILFLFCKGATHVYRGRRGQGGIFNSIISFNMQIIAKLNHSFTYIIQA
jgi:hypothetical protein